MTQEHVQGTEIQKLDKQKIQRRRLDEILGKFVRPGDIVYSDKGLVEQVIMRWKHDCGAWLGDPNE
jgi:hypothetical protein